MSCVNAAFLRGVDIRGVRWTVLERFGRTYVFAFCGKRATVAGEARHIAKVCATFDELALVPIAHAASVFGRRLRVGVSALNSLPQLSANAAASSTQRACAFVSR
jgi:hypothetical protein